MTSAVLDFWPAGCDAAGAFAARRPQDEAGGGHGSGLRERDHDPDALPPEGDHHLHLPTGTAGPSCSVSPLSLTVLAGSESTLVPLSLFP